MENRFEHHEKIFYDNEHTLGETRRLLAGIHGMALGMIKLCEWFRFDVVDADKWFNRITGGGVLAELEDTVGEIRDWTQEAHVNVRMALDDLDRDGGSDADGGE